MDDQPTKVDSEICTLLAAKEAQDAKKPRKPSRPRTVWLTPEEEAMNLAHYPAMDREVLRYVHGEELQENVRGLPSPKTGKRTNLAKAYVVRFNPQEPLPVPLRPAPQSPLCKQCALYATNPSHPFLNYVGADKPLVTVIFEGPNGKEDFNGAFEPELSQVHTVIRNIVDKTGVRADQIRWLGLTRCYSKGKLPNFKVKGNWCRYHIIDDLRRHPPKVIIPVGTSVLGSLSHKSNAQDWGGKILTWRGWPDDWLMNPKYALPQPDLLDPTRTKTGHPIFGPIPTTRLPLCPVQKAGLVLMAQNDLLTQQWGDQISAALKLAKSGVRAKTYTRPWYDWTEDPAHIETVLDELLQHEGILLAYDTETTGLRQWAPDAAIVSIMFRWTDPETGDPRSLGFPWQTKAFEMWRYIPRLKWKIWEVLCNSTLIGHNLTFDVLYTYATFFKGHLTGWDDYEKNLNRDSHLTAFTQAAKYDTWHMSYTCAQRRGSLGLEVIAYTYVADLAGYEEDMTILIDLHGDTMNPANGKGGHYLNVPKDKIQTHLVPYVMGDVEVAYKAHERLTAHLSQTKTYKIPLAAPGHLGYFRWFEPPRRDWVYEKVMSPAARTLMQMMARGMYVNRQELANLEQNLPAKIASMRANFTKVDPRIVPWIQRKEKEEPGWVLDLESKDHLRELLFEVLGILPDRLTKGGRKLYGDDLEDQIKRMVAEIAARKKGATQEDAEAHIAAMRFKYAAIDKFTLNALAVEHESLRHLLEYRKVFKLYTTYVRPLRNWKSIIDKKERKKDPHLCYDDCIHASFLLTGTRGGRLSCRDPNLQQLPRDGEVKSMFVSRFGARGCLYQADLSQIELRLMAAACGDPTMVQAYFDKVDLHSLTASRIFNVPCEHFSKDHMRFLQGKGQEKQAKDLDQKRNIAKTVNFLTGYGGGAFGLQNVLASKAIFKDLEECERIIELFFESYPALRALLQLYKGFILNKGCAVSIFGRVRVFEEAWGGDEEAKAKALRAGCNHLIQSTASDMMLVALYAVETRMREEGLESILVSTVHDSLLIDAVRAELPRIHEIVVSTLNNFPVVLPAVLGDDFDTSWMLVPFTGDCDVGTDYLNVKKVPDHGVDWDKLLAPKPSS